MLTYLFTRLELKFEVDLPEGLYIFSVAIDFSIIMLIDSFIEKL